MLAACLRLPPVYDLSNYDDVMLTYWRWYTNNLGNNPGNDIWSVQVSSNSGNDCAQDCSGVWGGTAIDDDCGICPTVPDYTPSSCHDCACVPNGDAQIDDCEDCIDPGCDSLGTPTDENNPYDDDEFPTNILWNASWRVGLPHVTFCRLYSH